MDPLAALDVIRDGSLPLADRIEAAVELVAWRLNGGFTDTATTAKVDELRDLLADLRRWLDRI
jgi:hypothetical protein